jgi:glycosyltransferase involved in cell wall biosynthesis
MQTISVVIPCHNAAPYLERSIGSVLNQSLPVKEIICIDDGSSDETLAVLKEMRRASPDKIEVISQQHTGSASARNVGLGRSTGSYIQFLDADDVVLPGKIEQQLSLCSENNGNADIVAGAFLLIPRKGLTMYVCPKFQDPWANLMISGLGVTSSNLWKRQAILDVGGWNEKQSASQEYELMFRMMQNNVSVLLSHAPLTEKYQVEGSIQSIGEPGERRKNAILAFIQLRRSISRYLDSQEILNDEILDEYRYLMHQKLVSISVYDQELAHEIHQQEIPADYRLPASDGLGVLAWDDLVGINK